MGTPAFVPTAARLWTARRGPAAAAAPLSGAARATRRPPAVGGGARRAARRPPAGGGGARLTMSAAGGGGAAPPLRVMVNGMPGKMATAVAEAVVARGLTYVFFVLF